MKAHRLTSKRALGHVSFYQHPHVAVPRVSVHQSEKRPHLGLLALDPVEEGSLLVEENRRDALLFVLTLGTRDHIFERVVCKATRGEAGIDEMEKHSLVIGFLMHVDR